ncbi:MAG TPA: ribosome silencing factor [Gammaproteobacteria bacterium]
MPKTASKRAKAKKRVTKKAGADAGRKTTRAKEGARGKKAAAAKTPAAKGIRKKRPARAARRQNGLAELALAALHDMKAQDVKAMDVRHLTSVTDTMIVAAGRSDRHVRAIADALIERVERAGIKPLGVEGQDAGEWVLVDLGDVVVHVMLPRVRDFYGIEKLWDISARDEAVAQ